MADEVAEEGGGGAGGSVLKRYGPLALIVLLAQVVLAWVVIQFTLKDNVSPEEQKDALLPQQRVELGGGTKEESAQRLPFYYVSDNLKNITANPAGTNAERFVVLSVQLGLVAYNRDEKPGEDDITAKLIKGEQPEILADIALYEPKIKSIILQITRTKTIDQLDGDFVHEVQDEIRKRLNREVFQLIFKVDNDRKIEVVVEEVVFSDLIIQ